VLAGRLKRRSAAKHPNLKYLAEAARGAACHGGGESKQVIRTFHAPSQRGAIAVVQWETVQDLML